MARWLLDNKWGQQQLMYFQLSFTSHPKVNGLFRNTSAISPLFCLYVLYISCTKILCFWMNQLGLIRLDWLLMNPDTVGMFFWIWKPVPVPAWVPWAVWSSLRLQGALWYNLYQKKPVGGKKKVPSAYWKIFHHNLVSKDERKSSKNLRKTKYIKLTAVAQFYRF